MGDPTMANIRQLLGLTAVLAVVSLAAMANEVDRVVPEADFVEEQTPGPDLDDFSARIETSITKAIYAARSQAEQLTEVATGSADLNQNHLEDRTPDAAKIEATVKAEEVKGDAKAAKVAVGQATTMKATDVVADLMHPSKHNPVDATVKAAFPLGVKETEKAPMPPPFDASEAYTGIHGHYHLGGGRRRVGAGFARERRTKVEPPASPTGSGSGAGSATGELQLTQGRLAMKKMMQTVLQGTVYEEDQFLKDDDTN